MGELRTLAEVAEARHTSPLRLLRFCHRHQVPVYRISRKSPWLFTLEALAVLAAAVLAPRPAKGIAAAGTARKTSKAKKSERRAKAVVLMQPTLISEAEIIKAAIRWSTFGTGIYFLIKKRKIVYVGQAANVLARADRHTASKDFDSWHWIPCPKRLLAATERAYIDALMPELNRDNTTLRRRKAGTDEVSNALA